MVQFEVQLFLYDFYACAVLSNLNNHATSVCSYHIINEFQSESTLCTLPECQGTPCSKQAPYLKFKWQQRNSNPQPLRKRTLNHLAKYRSRC